MNFHKQPNTFVGQVDLKVEDIERSLTFYQEIIGFQVLEQTGRKAKLTADGKTTLLSIEQPENVTPKQQQKTGLYHFALLLPNRSDLVDVVQHLLQNGYRFGSSDHLVSEALYLSDPDGNGIEIYTDRPASIWSWKDGEVAMTVDPLDFDNLLQEAKGGSWRGLPAGTVMGHIHLHVSELPTTEEFYHKGLGFDVVCQFGNQALFMSTGGYHHHIGLNTWAGVGAPAPPESSVGLRQFSLEYPSVEARNKVLQQLKQLQAAIFEENGVVHTQDPSGNVIQLNVNTHAN
ncbi:VOC family protein [Alteribacter populi]|uniref:VOC family protein n=1 Tax=Alteribacter populi TaxID=2011011 RepID=UPI000BBADD09|nr:VOC family protein [Alteribacter populi]